MKKFFGEIEDNFCSILLLVMTILTCINVFARYIFKSSMPFVEELTCLGLVILSVAGAAVAAKRGAHLGLTVLTDFLPKKVQKMLVIAGQILGCIFGFILLYYGILMTYNEFSLQQKTAGMQWPEWLYGMWIPISGALLVIRYIQLAIKTVKSKEEEE